MRRHTPPDTNHADSPLRDITVSSDRHGAASDDDPSSLGDQPAIRTAAGGLANGDTIGSVAHQDGSIARLDPDRLIGGFALRIIDRYGAATMVFQRNKPRDTADGDEPQESLLPTDELEQQDDPISWLADDHLSYLTGTRGAFDSPDQQHLAAKTAGHSPQPTPAVADSRDGTVDEPQSPSSPVRTADGPQSPSSPVRTVDGPSPTRSGQSGWGTATADHSQNPGDTAGETFIETERERASQTTVTPTTSEARDSSYNAGNEQPTPSTQSVTSPWQPRRMTVTTPTVAGSVTEVPSTEAATDRSRPGPSGENHFQARRGADRAPTTNVRTESDARAATRDTTEEALRRQQAGAERTNRPGNRLLAGADNSSVSRQPVSDTGPDSHSVPSGTASPVEYTDTPTTRRSVEKERSAVREVQSGTQTGVESTQRDMPHGRSTRSVSTASVPHSAGGRESIHEAPMARLVTAPSTVGSRPGVATDRDEPMTGSRETIGRDTRPDSRGAPSHSVLSTGGSDTIPSSTPPASSNRLTTTTSNTVEATSATRDTPTVSPARSDSQRSEQPATSSHRDSTGPDAVAGGGSEFAGDVETTVRRRREAQAIEAETRGTDQASDGLRAAGASQSWVSPSESSPSPERTTGSRHLSEPSRVGTLTGRPEATPDRATATDLRPESERPAVQRWISARTRPSTAEPSETPTPAAPPTPIDGPSPASGAADIPTHADATRTEAPTTPKLTVGVRGQTPASLSRSYGSTATILEMSAASVRHRRGRTRQRSFAERVTAGQRHQATVPETNTVGTREPVQRSDSTAGPPAAPTVPPRNGSYHVHQADRVSADREPLDIDGRENSAQALPTDQQGRHPDASPGAPGHSDAIRSAPVPATSGEPSAPGVTDSAGPHRRRTRTTAPASQKLADTEHQYSRRAVAGTARTSGIDHERTARTGGIDHEGSGRPHRESASVSSRSKKPALWTRLDVRASTRTRLVATGQHTLLTPSRESGSAGGAESGQRGTTEHLTQNVGTVVATERKRTDQGSVDRRPTDPHAPSARSVPTGSAPTSDTEPGVVQQRVADPDRRRERQPTGPANTNARSPQLDDRGHTTTSAGRRHSERAGANSMHESPLSPRPVSSGRRSTHSPDSTSTGTDTVPEIRSPEQRTESAVVRSDSSGPIRLTVANPTIATLDSTLRPGHDRPSEIVTWGVVSPERTAGQDRTEARAGRSVHAAAPSSIGRSDANSKRAAPSATGVVRDNSEPSSLSERVPSNDEIDENGVKSNIVGIQHQGRTESDGRTAQHETLPVQRAGGAVTSEPPAVPSMGTERSTLGDRSGTVTNTRWSSYQEFTASEEHLTVTRGLSFSRTGTVAGSQTDFETETEVDSLIRTPSTEQQQLESQASQRAGSVPHQSVQMGASPSTTGSRRHNQLTDSETPDSLHSRLEQNSESERSQIDRGPGHVAMRRQYSNGGTAQPTETEVAHSAFELVDQSAVGGHSQHGPTVESRGAQSAQRADPAGNATGTTGYTSRIERSETAATRLNTMSVTTLAETVTQRDWVQTSRHQQMANDDQTDSIGRTTGVDRPVTTARTLSEDTAQDEPKPGQTVSAPKARDVDAKTRTRDATGATPSTTTEPGDGPETATSSSIGTLGTAEPQSNGRQAIETAVPEDRSNGHRSTSRDQNGDVIAEMNKNLIQGDESKKQGPMGVTESDGLDVNGDDRPSLVYRTPMRTGFTDMEQSEQTAQRSAENGASQDRRPADGRTEISRPSQTERHLSTDPSPGYSNSGSEGRSPTAQTRRSPKGGGSGIQQATEPADKLEGPDRTAQRNEPGQPGVHNTGTHPQFTDGNTEPGRQGRRADNDTRSRRGDVPLPDDSRRYEADVDRIVERLYRRLERKERIERERKGRR